LQAAHLTPARDSYLGAALKCIVPDRRRLRRRAQKDARRGGIRRAARHGAACRPAV